MSSPMRVFSGTDTAHAANGVATFRDLRIDQPGTGYTLEASGGGLTPQRSDPFDVMPPPTTTGDLTVTTKTTGDTPDPNGYTVTVDGGANQSIPASGSVKFSPVASGPHTVDLSDVAPNCTVTNGTQRTVNVPVSGTGTATPPTQPDSPEGRKQLGAGKNDRRDAKRARDYMRQPAQRRSERRCDTGLAATRQRPRRDIEDSRTGNDGNDKRGEKE